MHKTLAHGLGLVARVAFVLRLCFRQASKAMRLNDLAEIPIPASTKRPSELAALARKTQSTGSIFGGQPKEVDLVSVG